MQYHHVLRVDAVQAVIARSPDIAIAIHHELTDVQAREGILALVREMIIGDAGSCAPSRRSRILIDGSLQSRLIHHEDTSIIGCHPHLAVLILHDVVSPSGGILARIVIDDEVHHLLCSSIKEIDAMVGTYPHIAIMVFIYLAHSVVSERIVLIVLLIPYVALAYQSVGTAKPPVAILGLDDGMQAVALARKGYLVERSICIIGMCGEARQAIVGTYPHILPLVHEASPHDVVGDRGSIARVMDIMLDDIVDGETEESVVGSDIKFALGIF